MQVKYADTPLVIPMAFTNLYRLERDLEVKYLFKGKPKTIVVPKGYLTDGASIPKVLWSLIGSPYQPRFLTAAIVHDFCCDQEYDVTEMSDLFFELLKLSNVRDLPAKLMRQAVYLYKSII